MKKLKEFPSQFVRFKINIPVLKEELDKAIAFEKPKGMDYRWFVNCEKNVMNFYRTWTGNCIYKAILNEDRNFIIEVLINNDSNEYKYSGKNEEEIASFHEIFDMLLSSSGYANEK